MFLSLNKNFPKTFTSKMNTIAALMPSAYPDLLDETIIRSARGLPAISGASSQASLTVGVLLFLLVLWVNLSHKDGNAAAKVPYSGCKFSCISRILFFRNASRLISNGYEQVSATVRARLVKDLILHSSKGKCSKLRGMIC